MPLSSKAIGPSGPTQKLIPRLSHPARNMKDALKCGSTWRPDAGAYTMLPASQGAARKSAPLAASAPPRQVILNGHAAKVEGAEKSSAIISTAK